MLDQAELAQGVVLYVGKTSTFTSIKDALAAASPGDTIIIAPGQYNESVLINKAGIDIRGNDSASTIINGDDGVISIDISSDHVSASRLSARNGMIRVVSDNVTLSDMIISASMDPSVELSAASNVTMRDVVIKDTLDYGIRADHSRDILLERLNCTDGTLVLASFVNNLTIRDCIFSKDQTALIIQHSNIITVGTGNVWKTSSFQPALFSECSKVRLKGGKIEQSSTSEGGMEFIKCHFVEVSEMTYNILDLGSKALNFVQSDNVTIKRFDLTSSSPSSEPSLDFKASKDASVEDCHFISTGDGATLLRVEDSIGFDIGNDTFDTTGARSFGLTIHDCDHILVNNNTFSIDGKGATRTFVPSDHSLLTRNIYYVSADDSIGANITGNYNTLKDETMFASGVRSAGIRTYDASNIFIEGARVRATGGSAFGIDVQNPSPARYRGLYINDTIVNATVDAGICLRANGEDSFLFITNSTFNTRSDPPTALLSIENAYISDSWFHGKTQGLGLQDCEVVQIVRTTMNGLTPCWARRSDHVLLADCDIYDLFLPVPGVKALNGSNVFLRDSHFEKLDCDGTSEITVSSSIKARTLTPQMNPLTDVDIEAISTPNVVYQTGHFAQFGGYPRTDLLGLVGPFTMVYARYINSNHPVHPLNTIEVYKEGTAGIWSATYPVNASEKRTIDLISSDIDLPQVPRNLTAVPLVAREAMFLNWELNQDDTTEYWVYKLDDASGVMALLDRVPSNLASYTTDDLGQRVNATFELRAFDGTYLSGASNRAFATTIDLTPPSVPTDLTASELTESSVRVSWEHPGAEDLALFEVLINDTSTSALFHTAGTVGPDERTFEVTGLSWNTWYHLKVRSIDVRENGSPLTEDLSVLTPFPPLKVNLQVWFDVEGPHAGEPANGSQVTLHLGSGSVEGTFETDGSGLCAIEGLVPEQNYYLEAAPPQGTEGVEGTKAGYLRATSKVFSLSAGRPAYDIELILPYQEQVVVGLIKVKVEFGGGQRTGPVYSSTVSLLDVNGTVLRTTLTSGEGTATFSITDLPFTGKVRASPPEDLEGDPAQEKDGYLDTESGTIVLTREEPLPDDVTLRLPYYEGPAPKRYLYILRKMPTGSSVNLDTPLSITFDQPVDTTSVEASINIGPALEGETVTWSSDRTTVTISHDGLKPKTSYQVSVGGGAVSLNGSSFPPGYTESTWTFRTTGEPGDGSDERPNLFVILMIAIALTIIIVSLTIWVLSLRNKAQVEEGDHLESLEATDIRPEGLTSKEYPSDIADGMMSGMPRDHSTSEE